MPDGTRMQTAHQGQGVGARRAIGKPLEGDGGAPRTRSWRCPCYPIDKGFCRRPDWVIVTLFFCFPTTHGEGTGFICPRVPGAQHRLGLASSALQFWRGRRGTVSEEGESQMGALSVRTSRALPLGTEEPSEFPVRVYC